MTNQIALIISVLSIAIISALSYMVFRISVHSHSKVTSATSSRQVVELLNNNMFAFPAGKLAGTGRDENCAQAFESITNYLKVLEYVEGY